MKAILISIQPKYVADILNGIKTLEIRKTMPKCDLPIDVYIYCTKGKEPCWSGVPRSSKYKPTILNGKIVAKFTLNKVERIFWKQDLSNPYVSDEYNLETDTLNEWELRNKSCLESEELEDYLGFDDSEFKALGYAWHIDNLEIFNEPKELSQFLIPSHKVKGTDRDGSEKTFTILKPLVRAPQSWCFVEI